MSVTRRADDVALFLQRRELGRRRPSLERQPRAHRVELARQRAGSLPRARACLELQCARPGRREASSSPPAGRSVRDPRCGSLSCAIIVTQFTNSPSLPLVAGRRRARATSAARIVSTLCCTSASVSVRSAAWNVSLIDRLTAPVRDALALIAIEKAGRRRAAPADRGRRPEWCHEWFRQARYRRPRSRDRGLTNGWRGSGRVASLAGTTRARERDRGSTSATNTRSWRGRPRASAIAGVTWPAMPTTAPCCGPSAR